MSPSLLLEDAGKAGRAAKPATIGGGPGGTTEAAVVALEEAGFRGIVDNALTACAEHSKTMGDKFDE